MHLGATPEVCKQMNYDKWMLHMLTFPPKKPNLHVALNIYSHILCGPYMTSENARNVCTLLLQDFSVTQLQKDTFKMIYRLKN